MRFLKISALDIIALAMAALVCVFAPAYAQTPAGHDGVPLTPEQERGLKRGDTFRECTDCPEMVAVPAGSFTMGAPSSEKTRFEEFPQHVVTFRQPFEVGKFHVTVDQFAAFVRETGYEKFRSCHWSSPDFAQDGTHPVVCVAWDDAKVYTDWLTKKTGRPYRLLSDAEFEYAAGAHTSPGDYPRHWFGDVSENDLCKYGNFYDRKAGDRTGCDDGYQYTSPAGHYPPNPFGLYDMFGNAWQWLEDCPHKNYNGAPVDGSAWTSACSEDGRVLRGGDWSDYPWYLRSRLNKDPGRLNSNGFRMARSLAPLDGSGN